MKRVFLDTNIVLRFIIGDIPLQKKQADTIFESIQNGEITGVISLLVVGELVWILERYYGVSRDVFIPKILDILLDNHVELYEIKKPPVIHALELMKTHTIDFTDIYLANIAKAGELATFDKKLLRLHATLSTE